MHLMHAAKVLCDGLCGNKIETASKHKDVGVLITSKLSFTTHLNYILTKAYYVLGMIRRAVLQDSDVKLKRSFYLSLVCNHLVYCGQVWRLYLVHDFRLKEICNVKLLSVNNYQMDYKQRLIQRHFLPFTLWLEVQEVML